MFYSQDLLCKRGGRFGAIWLLATSGETSRRLGITTKELIAVNISRTCADIIVPPVPLSLRLSSTLLIGLVRALARKTHLLFTDCHSTWSRILATPWITSKQGFDPFISAHTTVSNTNTITLKSVGCLDYLDVPDVADVTAVAIDESSRAHVDRQLQIWRELGWLGPAAVACPSPQGNELSAQQHSKQSFTSSWSSLSIPEPLAYYDGPRDLDRLHSATPMSADVGCLGSAAISIDSVTPPAITRHRNPVNYENEAWPDINMDAADNAEFHFDNSGNIRFASTELGGTSRGFSTGDEHTEELVQVTPNLPGQIISNNANPIAGISSGKSAPRAGVLPDLNGEPVANVDNQYTKVSSDDSPGIYLDHSSMSESNVLGADTFQLQQRSLDVLHILEEAEADVLNNWSALVACPPPNASTDNVKNICANQAKRRRLNNRHSVSRHYESDDHTYESRVEALWAGSCFWDREMIARSANTLGMHAQKCIRNRVSNLANVYALPANTAMEQIFCPSLLMTDDIQLADNGICNSPDQGSEWLDNAHAPTDSPNDGGLHFDDNNDSELELGRGGSPIANMENNDDNLLNMDLDIPWLHPEILKEVQRQQSIAQTPSVQTESSADQVFYQKANGSHQSTPASRVPSLDPPSSDDGLDIQHFELAAQNFDAFSATEGVPDTRGLDSFLDLSALSARVRDTNSALLAAEMNHEAQCFHRFVLTRMRDCGSESLGFRELLPLPYRDQRVAARAFVDLLQMASRSVFSVKQVRPYSEITIYSTQG
ncbi:R8 protein [Coemansia sp. RSA 988]|nr:R8 protein [Coemansia sp. RSA 988]